ncbi:MAG TPA: single-stranded DNA-binding protein, partial [Turneriella sp.]|nr:single-stranded DNA-binding protein [Turneriella sp.]
MANDINRVILIGRLTRDPELKSTNSGNYFCRFSLASNRNIYNKQTGESRDEVGFFDCVAWGKSAESIHKYLQKGRRICVDGSLRWSSWEGQDGKKQSKVEIHIETFQFLDSKQGDGAPRDAAPQEPSNPSAAAFDSGAMSDDDIPF